VPGGATWHRNQNELGAILRWTRRDLAAPIPPTEPIYQPQHLTLY
jgi:hypothetical protein